MAFANNTDRDQTPRNVGPDLRSILFDTQHHFLLETGCIAYRDEWNSKDINFFQFYKLSKDFWGALYITHAQKYFGRKRVWSLKASSGALLVCVDTVSRSRTRQNGTYYTFFNFLFTFSRCDS